MRLPKIRGVIERRLLVNFAVDPSLVARLLPPPFKPWVHGGAALVGVCLIRLREVRPAAIPFRVGARSENAAHRLAVVWREGDVERHGVYVPGRWTSSRFNACAGGKLFPGRFGLARFASHEDGARVSVDVDGGDGSRIRASGRATADWPAHSLFGSAAEAASFLRRGAIGWSFAGADAAPDGMELEADHWNATPFEIDACASSYLDDPRRFPPGALVFDHALLMREIPHAWVSRCAPSRCGP
jgi:hypothetical protein